MDKRKARASEQAREGGRQRSSGSTGAMEATTNYF